MKYYQSYIFEFSKEGRKGYSIPATEVPNYSLDTQLLRQELPNLPEVSELDVVRHYTNVSQKNFGVENGFYPLGSCTMKYNPKINDQVAFMEGFTQIHPLMPADHLQGFLEISFKLSQKLADITGMHAYSLNPFAGAHGELAGLMIMKKYHESRGDFKRTKIIVPNSAHGTNPASASVAGFDVVEIASNPDGTVSMEALKEVLSDDVAGLMLTNPNTAGVFEKDIATIAKSVHDIGGLLYYDGANLNALLGISKPGDMGFDITHLNLHKTFSTPHGGGGPGSGPVGVQAFLAPFLPGPVVSQKEDGTYDWMTPSQSIGSLGAFYGNASVYIRAYVYLLTMGTALEDIGRLSILNANYLKAKLSPYFISPIAGHAMHEFVFDGLKENPHGIKTLDVAKRLLDYGFHAPTVYFPLIFSQSMMVEPTETESLETLDQFSDVMKKIVDESIVNPEVLKHAPLHTIVKRLDEVKAIKDPILNYQTIVKKRS